MHLVFVQLLFLKSYNKLTLKYPNLILFHFRKGFLLTICKYDLRALAQKYKLCWINFKLPKCEFSIYFLI